MLAKYLAITMHIWRRGPTAYTRDRHTRACVGTHTCVQRAAGDALRVHLLSSMVSG